MTLKKLSDSERETLCAILRIMSSYHDHKENQGYAAFAVYFTLMGAASITSPWPLTILDNQSADRVIVAFGLTAVFYAAYFFIRWQLENRRWAATIVSSIASILIQDLVLDDSFKIDRTDSSYNSRKVRGWKRILHFFFPIRGCFFIEIDETNSVPKFLADRFKKNRFNDNGIFQERLVIVVMWVMFIIPFARCFW